VHLATKTKKGGEVVGLPKKKWFVPSEVSIGDSISSMRESDHPIYREEEEETDQ